MQKTENSKGFITLTPDEGYWLYDGESILTQSVFCPAADADKWQEITDDAAAAVKAELEAKAQAAAEERKAKRHTAEEEEE